MITNEVRRRYRAERAKGTPALYAAQIARTGTREPAHPFLSDLDVYESARGTVEPFTVSVQVVPDDQSRLGEDDVTGWFTDTYEDGCVPNTAHVNGHSYKYYRPCNDTLQSAYSYYRQAGMSKAVARDAVAEQIRTEMTQDAERSYWGVVVTVTLPHWAEPLARESLWGIDSIPGHDAAPYLIETAEELIGEALDAARAALPAVVQQAEAEIAALRTAIATTEGE